MKKQILQRIIVATAGFNPSIGPIHAEDFEAVFGSEDVHGIPCRLTHFLQYANMLSDGLKTRKQL